MFRNFSLDATFPSNTRHMILLFLMHMDLRTAVSPLTLWDRNVFRFFDEEKVVKSSDWGGDNWKGSLSRNTPESFF